jgi:stage II sporulation protein D
MRSIVVALAVVVLGGCSVAGPRPGARPAEPLKGPRSEPEVRVGVAVDADALELEGTASIQVVDEGGQVLARGTGPWTVTSTADGVEAAGPSGRVVAATLVARPTDGRVRIDGTAYRGAVLLRPGEAGVTAVNLVDLETYLLGVVPLEIGRGRGRRRSWRR